MGQPDFHLFGAGNVKVLSQPSGLLWAGAGKLGLGCLNFLHAVTSPGGWNPPSMASGLIRPCTLIKQGNTHLQRWKWKCNNPGGKTVYPGSLLTAVSPLWKSAGIHVWCSKKAGTTYQHVLACFYQSLFKKFPNVTIHKWPWYVWLFHLFY